MAALRRAGARRGASEQAWVGPEGIVVGSAGETAEILPEAAEHIFVARV
jgi:DtxR family Mn-dependent transcriptional regulator